MKSGLAEFKSTASCLHNVRHLSEREGGDNQARSWKVEYGPRSLIANCFNTILAGAAKKNYTINIFSYKINDISIC